MKSNPTFIQYILVRKDLRNTKGEKVRTGKLMGQVAHASCSSVKQSPEVVVQHWEEFDNQVKIVLQVKDLEELEMYEQRLKSAFQNSNPVVKITDAGKTEFSEPTVTCLAVLSYHSLLQPLLSDLKLY